jgi:hypothetical protein
LKLTAQEKRGKNSSPATTRPMHNQKLPTMHGPRFTAKQRRVLDAIGSALKHRQIDFFTAVELSDQVKAGQVDAVLEVLERLTGKPFKLTEPPDYSDEAN